MFESFLGARRMLAAASAIAIAALGMATVSPAEAAGVIILPCTTDTPAPEVKTYSSSQGTANYLSISGTHSCPKAPLTGMVSHSVVVAAQMWHNGQWVDVDDEYLYTVWNTQKYKVSASASMRCERQRRARYVRTTVSSVTIYNALENDVLVQKRSSASFPSKPVATRCWKRSTDRLPRSLDEAGPVLDKPVASLASPTSRTANYSINAVDDQGVVADMRVMATGDSGWRPWVPYSPTGTVILPDRFGDSTVWFQVRDQVGNVSSIRASNTVTRVQDVTPPTISGAGVSLGSPTWRAVEYSLATTDDLSPVTQMRVLVSGGQWRDWVPYNPTGTVVLPDGYGTFGVTFQVMDAAGNVSAPVFAGAVTRTADVAVTLRQIDNNGNLRSCGSAPETACTDIVKRFRTTISSALVPSTNVLLKAWRNVNGTWIETSTSPFMYEPISGRTTIDTAVTANLLSGLWRFQSQVPRSADGVTAFGASDYQYLRIG